MSGTGQAAAEPRRLVLRGQEALNGIDFVEIGDDRRLLTVVFFHPPPKDIGPDNFVVTGGVRVTDPKIVELRLIEDLDPDVERAVRLVFRRPGDASIYLLRVQGLEGFDPRYARIAFTFGDAVDRRLDCLPPPPPPPPPAAPPAPELDYLAKDYAGFSRLARDRLAQTLPGWTERHLPDIGVMLVDMLAYVGDQLSYYQDAVATEAYLGTARLRSSVRRHARLIDYTMHEGCNARVWMHVGVSEDLAPDAADLRFTLDGDDTQTEFAPIFPGKLAFSAACNEIAFHAWGDGDSCLPAGSVSATLRDRVLPDGSRALAGLQAGQALLIEKVARSGAGWTAGALQRHIVRLTRAERKDDQLYGVPVIDIAWAAEDALPFPVALDVPGASADAFVWIARGNMVLADHGSLMLRDPAVLVTETIAEQLPPRATALAPAPGSDGAVLPAFMAPPRRPRLRYRGLTFAEPVRPDAPATLAVQQTAYRALPQIISLTCAPDPRLGLGAGTRWEIRPDLISSRPSDTHVVVEVDDDGGAVLRFGDGDCGARPDTGPIKISYRVGNGPSGNVGAETLTRVVDRNGAPFIGLAVRNPLPATGGTLPEQVSGVRWLAPAIFRAKRERAVTAGDYAAAAEGVFGVRRATADILQIGLQRLVRVAILPDQGEDPHPELIARVASKLAAVRRIGHDMEVGPASIVGLDVAILVGVRGNFLQAHVLAALRDALGSGLGEDGQPAFFHPDRMSFGSPVHGSRIVAAAQAVTGVEWVKLTRLRRISDAPPDDPDQVAHASISILLGQFEVARMNNDPVRPEYGHIDIVLRGGR